MSGWVLVVCAVLFVANVVALVFARRTLRQAEHSLAVAQEKLDRPMTVILSTPTPTLSSGSRANLGRELHNLLADVDARRRRLALGLEGEEEE